MFWAIVEDNASYEAAMAAGGRDKEEGARGRGGPLLIQANRIKVKRRKN